MGRPINNIYIGNSATAGQQIVGHAWVAGDSQPRLSYIVKQRGTHSYIMSSTDGTGVPGGGQIYLVNGPVTQAGQGNVMVTPYGATGTGAHATANLGISSSPTIAVSGSGAATASYAPGETLHLVGGTYTTGEQAAVTVNSVNVRLAAIQAGGTGYAVGDYFLFNNPGFTTQANVVVTTEAAGVITGVSVHVAGVYTNHTLPTNPVSPSATHSTSGVGATFNLGWGLNSVSVATEGDYTAIPSNPVSLTGSANGTGAEINVTYSVSSVKVTAGGTGYLGAPAVTFSTGNASASATVTSGSVSSIAVISGGSGYTAIPTVTLADTASVQYATKITDRIVFTFNGSQYEWLLTGQTLPGYGWATIQSQ